MHEKSNIDQQEFSVRTELTQLPIRKSCVYGLAARLNVSVPCMERQAAQDLVDAAHQLCPYSNATRGNIEVALVHHPFGSLLDPQTNEICERQNS